MKSRSPRVVAIGRNPLRMTVGDLSSHTVMPASIKAMQVKKTVTGVVQTIQSNMMLSLNAAHRETLRDVVAHEPDDDRAGHDRQHARGGERGPVHAGGGDGAGHRRDDRL